MVITLTGKDTFNALTGSAIGEDKEVTYTLDVSGEDLVAGEVDLQKYCNVLCISRCWTREYRYYVHYL